MNILTITALCVCASVFCLCVKEIKPDIGHLITIGSSVLILLFILPYAQDAISAVLEFSSYSGTGGKYFEPILKITGIAYVTQMGSELCLDANEKALSSRVEMAGKLAILTLTLPIAKEAFIRIIGIIN